MNVYKEETIMQDKLETIGSGSLIQHGKLSDRIYLMKLHRNDFPIIIEYLNGLASKHKYSKLFCKVPVWAAPLFISNGFFMEAHIPHFYNNQTDAFFLSKFMNSDRIMNIENSKLEELAVLLASAVDSNYSTELPESHVMKKLELDHAEQISSLYEQVFDSYPFPIFDPNYIRETMQEHIEYYGIEKEGKLIALASSETDKAGSNAEMTDFATLPEYRGQNLSVLLLNQMEIAMQQAGIKTLYTIARLNSMAMNKTFLKCGYAFGGTLINNTNIAGKIESMNVYYKTIH